MKEVLRCESLPSRIMKNWFFNLYFTGFCDKIYNWINEIASFVPGDNGMPVYLYDNYDVELDGGYIGQVPPKNPPVVAVPAPEPVAKIVAEPEVVVPVPEPVAEVVTPEPIVEDIVEEVEEPIVEEVVEEEVVEDVVEPVAELSPSGLIVEEVVEEIVEPEPVVEKVEEEVVASEPVVEVAAPTPTEPVVEEVPKPEVVVAEPVAQAAVEPQVAAPAAEPVAKDFMQSAISDMEVIVTSPGNYVSKSPKTTDNNEDSSIRKRIKKFFRRD